MTTQADLVERYKKAMDPDYVQQLSKQYGITPDQVYALYASSSNPYQSASTGNATGQYGLPTQNSAGSTPNNTFEMLSLLKNLGITGGGDQQQKQGPTNIGGVSTSAKDLATNMGANRLGMHAIYNPTPQDASSVSGVGKVAKATESDVVPSMGDSWNEIGKAAGWSQKDLDTFKASGATPQQVADKMGLSLSPWLTTPGLYTKAASLAPTAGTPGGQDGQAATPTPQATAAQVGTPTPFATAPAAPGIQIPQEAHVQALANAGMAMYAHYGGDPHSASPEQINNFHSELMNGIQSVASNAAAPQGTPAASQAAPAAPQGGEPVKMRYGGVVPGDPNDDTDSVNAKLSPGEVVVPKPQAKRLTERPAPMQTATATNPPPAAPGATTNSGATASPSSSAPSASGGYTGPTAMQIAQQNLAAQRMGQPTGPGSGMPTMQAAGVISGLADGLTSAAKTYADSVKEWQVQASHIPDPDAFKNRYQTTTFGQSLA